MGRHFLCSCFSFFCACTRTQQSCSLCVHVLVWVSFHGKIAEFAVHIFLKPSESRKRSVLQEASCDFFFFILPSRLVLFSAHSFVTSPFSCHTLQVLIVVIDCACLHDYICAWHPWLPHIVVLVRIVKSNKNILTLIEFLTVVPRGKMVPIIYEIA